MLDVNSKILDLEITDRLDKLSAKDLKKILLGSDISKKSTNVIDSFESHISNIQQPSTRNQYNTTCNWIKKYTNNKPIEFKDINVGWLKLFENYLSNEGVKTNAIWVYMKCLRAIFNNEIDKENISLETYPFRRYKLKQEPTRKRSLTVEQLRKFKDCPCDKYQVKYQDTFMLIFYLIGINIKDLLYLTEMVDGRIEYKRAKTNRLYSIKVEPEALEIINKYKGENYLLNFMDDRTDYVSFRAWMNKAIGKVGAKNRKDKGLIPELTTYYARHTWATIASKIGIQRDTIAAALGHGGNTVTDIYIDFDQTKVDEANRKVIDYVLQKGEYTVENKD